MYRALLLDEIKPVATEAFQASGIEVVPFAKADDLGAPLTSADALALRSAPKVPAEMIAANLGLLTIGVFGSGYDHVSTESAMEHGVAVFHAPGENARSVAELVMGSTYSLMRHLHEHNQKLHAGEWSKTDAESFELQGKTIGVIGYGNIGQIVGKLAKGNDMDAVYFDLEQKADNTDAEYIGDIDEVLARSDIVTVHINGKKPIIGERELGLVKPGSFLINTARSTAIDNVALLAAIKSGHIRGAALDVHFDEPKSKIEAFTSIFQGEPRVMLTPHIGASTQEAQIRAAVHASGKMIDFLLNGVTTGALTVPNISALEIPQVEGTTRITSVHKNETGAITELEELISLEGLNINGQRLKTGTKGTALEHVGYAVVDVDAQRDDIDLSAFNGQGLKHNIRLRVL